MPTGNEVETENKYGRLYESKRDEYQITEIHPE